MGMDTYPKQGDSRSTEYLENYLVNNIIQQKWESVLFMRYMICFIIMGMDAYPKQGGSRSTEYLPSKQYHTAEVRIRSIYRICDLF